MIIYILGKPFSKFQTDYSFITQQFYMPFFSGNYFPTESSANCLKERVISSEFLSKHLAKTHLNDRIQFDNLEKAKKHCQQKFMNYYSYYYPIYECEIITQGNVNSVNSVDPSCHRDHITINSVYLIDSDFKHNKKFTINEVIDNSSSNRCILS